MKAGWHFISYIANIVYLAKTLSWFIETLGKVDLGQSPSLCGRTKRGNRSCGAKTLRQRTWENTKNINTPGHQVTGFSRLLVIFLLQETLENKLFLNH